MLIYQAVVTVLLLAIGFNFLLNWFCFRKPVIVKNSLSPGPLISILIPARNEELRIGKCLDSLLVQNYANLEILILDDHSTDGTAALLQSYARRDPRIRLLAGKELPSRWTGKGWACQQLGEQALGDWLLFTDADTIHAVETVSSAYAEAQKSRSDLLSLWPRQKALTWSEVLVIPFVHVLLLFFLPHWMPGGFRSLGAANGQFLLFRRIAYQEIGGHESVKGHLVDDVALAREIKVRRLRLANRDGSDLVECRMYENVRQLWEGFSKNLRAGCEGSLAGFLFLFGIQFIVLFLPFLWVFPVFYFPQLAPWILTQIIVILALRAALALKCRQPIISALRHPLGQALLLAIALNSWWKTSQGKVTWKGRIYGS